MIYIYGQLARATDLLKFADASKILLRLPAFRKA